MSKKVPFAVRVEATRREDVAISPSGSSSSSSSSSKQQQQQRRQQQQQQLEEEEQQQQQQQQQEELSGLLTFLGDIPDIADSGEQLGPWSGWPGQSKQRPMSSSALCCSTSALHRPHAGKVPFPGFTPVHSNPPAPEQQPVAAMAVNPVVANRPTQVSFDFSFVTGNGAGRREADSVPNALRFDHVGLTLTNGFMPKRTRTRKRKRERRWEEVHAALLVYQAENGDLEVPYRFVVPSGAPWSEEAWGMKLGRKVSDIRNHKTYVKDQPERCAKLDALGFVWDEEERRWEEVHAALLVYQAENGDLKVPSRFVVPSGAPWSEEAWGMQLGWKVSDIRRKQVYVKDQPERHAKLDKMGFRWKDPNAPKRVKAARTVDAENPEMKTKEGEEQAKLFAQQIALLQQIAVLQQQELEAAGGTTLPDEQEQQQQQQQTLPAQPRPAKRHKLLIASM